MSIVQDQTDAFLSRARNLPAAPKILMPLLAALSDPETDLSHVVDMIAVDPGLTARLLQLCNCAYLNKGGPVIDVGEAVGRLGFQTVYRAVALARVDGLMRPSAASGIDAAQLWRHSATVALAAQFIAHKKRLPANTAFTAGLLHDIGKVVMADTLQPGYGRLCDEGRVFGADLVEREKLRYTVEHAEVGARLLDRWNTPADLVAAVRFHHTPEAALERAPLAACLQLADTLAHQFDGAQNGSVEQEFEAPAALAILGLELCDIAFYGEEIQQHLEFVEALCRMRS